MDDIATRDVLKIREAVARAQMQGIPLTEYSIRKAIKAGQIPCRRLGTMYLITWKNLMDWVTCANGSDNFEKAVSD